MNIHKKINASSHFLLKVGKKECTEYQHIFLCPNRFSDWIRWQLIYIMHLSVTPNSSGNPTSTYTYHNMWNRSGFSVQPQTQVALGLNNLSISQDLQLIKTLHHTFPGFAQRYYLFNNSKSGSTLELIDKLTTMTDKTATVLHIPWQPSYKAQHTHGQLFTDAESHHHLLSYISIFTIIHTHSLWIMRMFSAYPMTQYTKHSFFFLNKNGQKIKLKHNKYKHLFTGRVCWCLTRVSVNPMSPDPPRPIRSGPVPVSCLTRVSPCRWICPFTCLCLKKKPYLCLVGIEVVVVVKAVVVVVLLRRPPRGSVGGAGRLPTRAEEHVGLWADEVRQHQGC